MLRAKKGHFKPCIAQSNFDGAVKWVKDLGYEGPLVLAADDTKITAALRSYQDGGSWHLGGMHGRVETFTDYEELIAIAQSHSQESLADKVRVLAYLSVHTCSLILIYWQARAWVLIIPLPGIPPKVIATMPVSSKVDIAELKKWHDEIQANLEDRDLHVISYNVDGASHERGLTHDVQRAAEENKQTYKWAFPHPTDGLPFLVLTAPTLKNGKPCIMSTDGKHAKKNARGSATSGTRVLVLGPYLVHFGQLADLATSLNSPLLKTDIIGVDKQDDRAAARLFSSATIEHLSRTQRDELGLIIYLFIIGELIDAQQNREIELGERMKMLWRGRFFLEGWRQSIVNHPHYSPLHHLPAFRHPHAVHLGNANAHFILPRLLSKNSSSVMAQFNRTSGAYIWWWSYDSEGLHLRRIHPYDTKASHIDGGPIFEQDERISGCGVHETLRVPSLMV